MFGSTDAQIDRATELHEPPAKGQPYSVALPGSEAEGRSAIDRHWRFTDKPLLDHLAGILTNFDCALIEPAILC